MKPRYRRLHDQRRKAHSSLARSAGRQKVELMTVTEMSHRANKPVYGVVPALGLALLIVGVEYMARHFALLWFPAIGALRVNDMLVTGLAYLTLVAALVPAAQRTPSTLGATLRAVLAEGRHWQVWAAATAAIGSGFLVLADQRLWGGVSVPAVSSPWRWDGVLFASAAPLLVTVCLLLVNGWVVPLAEEWLWRGRIQPALVGAGGQLAGLLVTSVLFSLKHVLIDASLGRLLALTGFGLVMGLLALRRGWRASALAHAIANTFATALTLLLSGGQA
jgi:membrane protease YdiL (CAAX protease family)